MKQWVVLVGTLCLFFFSPLLTAKELVIGVLAIQPKEVTLKHWAPLATILNHDLPEHRFSLKPLGLTEIDNAMKNGELDFVIATPRHSVVYEDIYNSSHLATVVRQDPTGELRKQYGGVIITKANRNDIRTLSDIKGKVIAATDQTGFASFLLQYDVLHNAGIDIKSAATVNYLGQPLNNIIEAVRQNRADVGFIRTGFLEELISKKLVREGEFNVINPQRYQGFVYAASTSLHPEWAFLQTPSVSTDISKKVIISLMKIGTKIPSGSSEFHSFDPPLAYTSVQELMKKYYLPPYDTQREFNVIDVIQKYLWQFLLVGFTVTIVLLVVALRYHRLSRRLEEEKKRVQDQEELYYTILNASAEAIEFLDCQTLKYIEFNNVTASFLGYTREELKTKTLYDIQVEYNGESLKVFIQGLMQCRNVTHFETQHRTKQGKILDVAIGVSPVTLRGKDYLCAVWHDITETKKIQNELEKYRMSLEETIETRTAEIHALYEEQQKQQLLLVRQGQTATMGEMLSAIAHHWRQPLSVISLSAQNMEYFHEIGELTPKMFHENTETIVSVVTQMSRTIDKVSYLFSNTNEEYSESFRILQQVGDILAQEFSYYRISLYYSQNSEIIPLSQTLLPEGLKRVNIAKDELGQIFHAVLANARDAIIKKSRIQSNFEGAITISIDQFSNRQVITISDNGGGIDENIMPRMFDPFVTTKERGQGVNVISGVGLGLYIAKMIVEEHCKGSITAENRADGATICITFPLTVQ